MGGIIHPNPEAAVLPASANTAAIHNKIKPISKKFHCSYSSSHELC